MSRGTITKFCCDGEDIGEVVMSDLFDCSDDELLMLYGILVDACNKCLVMQNIPSLIYPLRDILEYYAVEVANRSLQQNLTNPSAGSDERTRITTSPCSSRDGDCSV